MDLKIKYSNGSMVVHLEEFMNCRNMSKFKKLVNLIRKSYNPDDLDRLKEYIEQELNEFEPRQKEHERYIVGYTDKVKFCLKQIENGTHNRERFKKKSDGWEHYNTWVKQYRQEMTEFKKLRHNRKIDFDNSVRNQTFYTKCLEVIS